MLNVKQRREAHAKREAAELITEYGEHRAACALDVHITTVRRWASGKTLAPAAVLIALRALVKSQLPGMEMRDWEGRHFDADGFLVDNAGQRHHRGDIQGRFMERQHIRYLQRQVALLKRKLASVKDGAANDAVEGELTGAVRS